MKAIIFDVDGTLWNSTEQVAAAWTQAVSEHTQLKRTITSEDLMREFGKPMDKIVNALFPELSKEEQESLSVHLFRYENRRVETAPCEIYEGMPETIRELSRSYPLLIVSNCQGGYIEAFLKNTGLSEYFGDHMCPDDTGQLKAENIRLIMERNGITEAVYVGDTQGDADACKEARIPMIYAAYGFGDVEGEYVTIHSFNELLSLDYEGFWSAGTERDR